MPTIRTRNLPVLVAGEIELIPNATYLPDPALVPIGSIRVVEDAGTFYFNEPINGWVTIITEAPGVGVVTSVNGLSGAVVLSTTLIPEGSNLYYTDARVRAAALTTTITSGDTTHAPDGNTVFNALALKVPTSRNVNTTSPLVGGGSLAADLTLSIPVATGSVNGYLSAADWTTFNSKQTAGNYVTGLTGDVSATGPGTVSSTVNSVGGSSASNIHSAELLANAATASQTANTIVKRNANADTSIRRLLTSGGVDVWDLENRRLTDPNGRYQIDAAEAISTIAAIPNANVIGQLAKTVTNGSAQFLIQNLSTGSSASGDYIVNADTGTDSNNYLDLGINSSGFSSAGWTINGALDAYLYNNDGGLAIGSNVSGLTPAPIKFFQGGSLAANLIAQFNNTGTLQLGKQSGTSPVNLQFVNSQTATLAWNPSVTQTLTLPATAPVLGAYLGTDGSGNLSWSFPIQNVDGGRASSVYGGAIVMDGGNSLGN